MNLDTAEAAWVDGVVGRERVHLSASHEWDYVGAAQSIWRASPTTRVFRAVPEGFHELHPAFDDDLGLDAITRRYRQGEDAAGDLPVGFAPATARAWLRRDLLGEGAPVPLTPEEEARMTQWMHRRGGELLKEADARYALAKEAVRSLDMRIRFHGWVTTTPALLGFAADVIARTVGMELKDVDALLRLPTSTWCYANIDADKEALTRAMADITALTGRGRMDLLANSLT